MAEKIYTSDELMLEVASVTPREYDGGFIDNPDGECGPSLQIGKSHPARLTKLKLGLKITSHVTSTRTAE